MRWLGAGAIALECALLLAGGWAAWALSGIEIDLFDSGRTETPIVQRLGLAGSFWACAILWFAAAHLLLEHSESQSPTRIRVRRTLLAAVGLANIACVGAFLYLGT
jgi:hypothetical protein